MKSNGVNYTPELRAKLSASAKRRCTPEWRAAVSKRNGSNLPKEEVESLYASGIPQHEIANRFGVSQAAVSRFMISQGMKRGRNRDQSGENNPCWKGNEAGYESLHRRVETLYGKPRRCEVCGSQNDPKTIYDWANLTGKYEDPNDYKRMCRSCHSKYDDKAKNFKGIKPYTYRPRGKVATA